MQKVPKIISTKDLSYISDIFNWHFTTLKKTLSFTENVNDKDICQAFENVTNILEKNCQELIKILN